MKVGEVIVTTEAVLPVITGGAAFCVILESSCCYSIVEEVV